MTPDTLAGLKETFTRQKPMFSRQAALGHASIGKFCRVLQENFSQLANSLLIPPPKSHLKE